MKVDKIINFSLVWPGLMIVDENSYKSKFLSTLVLVCSELKMSIGTVYLLTLSRSQPFPITTAALDLIRSLKSAANKHCSGCRVLSIRAAPDLKNLSIIRGLRLIFKFQPRHQGFFKMGKMNLETTYHKNNIFLSHFCFLIYFQPRQSQQFRPSCWPQGSSFSQVQYNPSVFL